MQHSAPKNEQEDTFKSQKLEQHLRPRWETLVHQTVWLFLSSEQVSVNQTVITLKGRFWDRRLFRSINMCTPRKGQCWYLLCWESSMCFTLWFPVFECILFSLKTAVHQWCSNDLKMFGDKRMRTPEQWHFVPATFWHKTEGDVHKKCKKHANFNRVAISWCFVHYDALSAIF